MTSGSALMVAIEGEFFSERGVLLVGEAPDRNGRARILGEHRLADGTNCPVSPVLAVRDPGLHHARIAADFVREADHGRQITLEVSTGDAQTWREIRVGAYAAIEFQCRHDFRPIGIYSLAKLRQRVGDRYR